MKSVDVTLLVQVVNFFIAYWFLHRYIFVPAAKILEAEQLQDMQMQKLIQGSLEQRDHAKKSMKHRMLQIKQSLLNCIPLGSQKPLLNLDDQKLELLKENVVLSEQERQSIKKIISDKISEVKL